MGPPPDDDVDERFRALLAGIRTTLPGSQVLFGFLLTVPLQAGFGDLDELAEAAFLVALVTTALASVLLIAPSAQARARLPVSGLRRETKGHVTTAAYLALAGTVSLAVGISAATFLSVYLLLELVWASVMAVVLALVTFLSWFGLPLLWTARGE